MTKYALIAIAVFVFAFRVWQSTGCQQFNGFYFNPLIIRLSAEANLNLDPDSSYISHFFHNKVSVGAFEFFKVYAAIFEPRHLLEITGPLGMVLLFISLAKLLEQKKKSHFIHFLAILTTGLILMSTLNPKISFFLFAASLWTFSLKSVPFFTKTKLRVSLFLILSLSTLWYFSLTWQMTTICKEIFFR